MNPKIRTQQRSATMARKVCRKKDKKKKKMNGEDEEEKGEDEG